MHLLRSVSWSLLLVFISVETTLAYPHCPLDRQVAILNPAVSTSCLALPGSGWVGSRLFPGATPGTALAAYCVYDWVGPSEPLPSGLPSAGGPTDPLEEIAPDCHIVAAHGHPFTTENASQLETAALLQIEALNPLPRPSTSTSPTTVVVVDSAVDQAPPLPGSGYLDHGEDLGTWIRTLACPGGGPVCQAEVATSLALALLRVEGQSVRDTTNGGDHGSLADLATSIFRRYALLPQPPGNVVVNLSLGWLPHNTSPLAIGMPSIAEPPVRAVFDVLREASCHGHLVVAAAGNVSSEAATPAGPILPAAWETLPAPGSAECANDFGIDSAPADGYTPLLHAVQALDGRDGLPAMARPDSTPPLMAPGAHGLVASANLGARIHTGAYTGSSWAVASVSAVAATVWSYEPLLEAHEVISHIKSSGVGLGHPVDFSFASPFALSTAVRVSFCRAIKDACLRTGCLDPVSCPSAAPGRDLRPQGLTFNAVGLSPLSFVHPVTSTFSAPCGGTLVESSKHPAGSNHPCPRLDFPTNYDEPGTHPAPGPIICPTCVLIGDPVTQLADLRIGISDAIGQSILSNPVLRVEYQNGQDDFIILPIFASDLFPQAAIEVLGLPVSTGSVVRAEFQVEVIDPHGASYVSSSEILVE